MECQRSDTSARNQSMLPLPDSAHSLTHCSRDALRLTVQRSAFRVAAQRRSFPLSVWECSLVQRELPIKPYALCWFYCPVETFTVNLIQTYLNELAWNVLFCFVFQQGNQVLPNQVWSHVVALFVCVIVFFFIIPHLWWLFVCDYVFSSLCCKQHGIIVFKFNPFCHYCFYLYCNST